MSVFATVEPVSSCNSAALPLRVADLCSARKPSDKTDQMKNLWLCLVVAGLCGCASQYVMKLTNGQTISTPGKPKLRGANYYYKGIHGEEQAIPQSRVLEIEPASMAKEEKKFKASEPKKKHWYWPF